MKSIVVRFVVFTFVFTGMCYAKSNLAGEWVLTYDEKLDGVVDAVHSHAFSIKGSGKKFTGRYIGHEKKAKFDGQLFKARKVTLIHMKQHSKNFFRLYSGIKKSDTLYVGSFHGVGNGPPGWSGDWKLEKKRGKPSEHDINYVKGFQGVWDSNWGRLTFIVEGIRVTGTYPHDAGKINATLSADGQTMEGTWSESPSYKPPKDAGRVIFKLSPDGKTISGHWWYGENTEGGDWTGTKVN